MVVLIDAAVPWRARPIGFDLTMGNPPPVRKLAPAAPVASASAKEETLFARYRTIIATFAPAPYPGRLAVLRSDSMKDLRPCLGWSDIGQQVETHAIPGDHFASITRNIATTAARVRACLDSAYR